MPDRTVVSQRPAAWAAIGLGVGICLADRLSLPALYPVAGAGVCFVAASISVALGPGERRWLDACLLGLVICLGAARLQVDTRLLPADHISRCGVLGMEGSIRGRVADEPERTSERTRFLLDLEELSTAEETRRVSGRILVTCRNVSVVPGYGDRVAILGRLTRPAPARNPGAFDYRRFLWLRGIHGTLSVRRSEQLLTTKTLPGTWFQSRVVLPVRGAIRRSIAANLTGASAGLLQGMLLGEKHRIPEDIRGSFRGTGLAHALVISGLHVGLVALFFFTGLRVCRLPDRVACVGTIGILALYAVVTELQPPVVRASIMATVVLTGRLLGRQGEIYNSLGLAAVIILCVWPTSLMSLSFQLSFGASLAIVGLHGPLIGRFPEAWRREDQPLGKWVISPLCVSLAAQLGTGPLIAYHFQQFAPISLAANLIVVPLLGLVVGLGILTALTGWWLPLAATAFNAGNYLVLSSLIRVVDALAEIPYASVVTPRPGPVALVLAALTALLLARDDRRSRRILVYLVLISCNLGVWSHLLRARQLEVVFLDVGQGDAAFLQFPNGRTMVIDGGNRSFHFDYGDRVLVPFLRYRNVSRVDVVVATHPHNDHIGGLVSLLEQIEIGHFIDSGQVFDSWTAGRLRELIRDRGIHYHRVAAGDTLIGLGGVGGLVLHPTSQFVSAEGSSAYGLNNGSAVVRFTHGDLSLLFTGDVEEETDASLLRWGERLQTRVLKVAHHGSPTSSEPRFLEGVDPEVAVVSVGAINGFGHPSAEVMTRYMDKGVRLLRTDKRGAVMLWSDGEGYGIRCMLAAP